MGPSRARAFGLAAATFAGITLAYTASALLLAGPEAFAHPALHLNAIYAALIAFSVAVFVYALGLPLNIWPSL